MWDGDHSQQEISSSEERIRHERSRLPSSEMGMRMEDVLAIWTPARLAEVLETSAQSITPWIRSGFAPRSREYELQVKSGGRLQASNFDPDRDYVSGGLLRKRRGR